MTKTDGWGGHFLGENPSIFQGAEFRAMSEGDLERRNTNSNKIPQDAPGTNLHHEPTALSTPHWTTARGPMAGPKYVAVFQSGSS